MLAVAFVVLLGMSFLEAIATTKVMNVFSSAVATAIFAAQGVLDWKLGFILGIAMFLGALIGARITLLLSAVWLRRIFSRGWLRSRQKCSCRHSDAVAFRH